MIEIRFHGRGGQGTVLASELLAEAAFLEGKFPQSFPFFGVERRGAPVTAFTRIDACPIRVRTGILEPDVVVVLDPGLLGSVPVTAGLKPGGLLLLNRDRAPPALALPPQARVVTVGATAIAAARGLGSRATPIVNTAVLGALSRVTGAVGLDALCRAVLEFAPGKREANAAAARDAWNAVAPQEAAVT